MGDLVALALGTIQADLYKERAGLYSRQQRMSCNRAACRACRAGAAVVGSSSDEEAVVAVALSAVDSDKESGTAVATGAVVTLEKERTTVAKRRLDEYFVDDSSVAVSGPPKDPRPALKRRAESASGVGGSTTNAAGAAEVNLDVAAATGAALYRQALEGLEPTAGSVMKDLLGDVEFEGITPSLVPGLFVADVAGIALSTEELHTSINPVLASTDSLTLRVKEAMVDEQVVFPGGPGKYTVVSLDGSDVTADQRDALMKAYGFKSRWLDVYARLKVVRKALHSAREVLNTCTYTLDYLQGEYELLQGTGGGGVIALLHNPEMRFGSL